MPPGPPIGYGPGNNNTQVTWSNVTVKISHRKNAILELHGDTNPLLLYRVVRWGPYISLFVDHVCTLRNVFNFYRKLKGAVTTVVSSVLRLSLTLYRTEVIIVPRRVGTLT